MKLAFRIYISKDFYFPFDFIFGPIPTLVHGAFRVVATTPSYRSFSTSLHTNPIRCPSLLNETFHVWSLFCFLFSSNFDQLSTPSRLLQILQNRRKSSSKKRKSSLSYSRDGFSDIKVLNVPHRWDFAHCRHQVIEESTKSRMKAPPGKNCWKLSSFSSTSSYLSHPFVQHFLPTGFFPSSSFCFCLLSLFVSAFCPL